ncbi:hypothetical protein Zm00014a_003230 [Zea mays]|uniref:Uncharacterized protein n=1 Tax=Zea mays TaxID=4577 RepID=A0A317Y495_MAIZE|nr:hypothetical protein Zm00014a_003230 [Zea mays]
MCFCYRELGHRSFECSQLKRSVWHMISSGKVAASSADSSRPETKISVWRRINLPEPSAVSGDVLREQPRPKIQISVWMRLTSSSVLKVKKLVWRRKDHQHLPEDTTLADRNQKPSSMEGDGRGLVSQEFGGIQSKR